MVAFHFSLALLVLLACMSDAANKGTPLRSSAASRLRESDIDRILANNRIVTSYVKCLLDQDPCSPDGSELKRALPDALATGCKKCSANEKLLSDKVIVHLMQKRKGDWAKLVAKYDPKGEFTRHYRVSSTTTKPATRARTMTKQPK